MLRAEQYRPLAAAAAARWGASYGVSVPVDVVVAMIMKESSGIPSKKRTEPDGRISRGLLQVLEGTARDLGVTKPLTLHEPAIGVDTGVKYFAQKLKRYGGNVTHAIAAYNSGTAYIGKKSGKYKNQGYVDAVLKWLEQVRLPAKPKSPGQGAAPAGRAALLVPVLLLGAVAWAIHREQAAA